MTYFDTKSVSRSMNTFWLKAKSVPSIHVFTSYIKMNQQITASYRKSAAEVNGTRGRRGQAPQHWSDTNHETSFPGKHQYKCTVPTPGSVGGVH